MEPEFTRSRRMYRKLQPILIVLIIIFLLIVSCFLAYIKYFSKSYLKKSAVVYNQTDSISELEFDSEVESIYLINTNTTYISNLKYLIEPISYKIFLYYPLESYNNWIFRGNVFITLHVGQDVKYIVIGVSDLRIFSATLKKLDLDNKESSEEIYKLGIASYDKEDGTMILQIYKPLTPYSTYILHIEYQGDLQQMSYGLYKIQNVDQIEKKERILIAGNTEVPFARTIFPCFDLPIQTATYQLNVCRHSSLVTFASSQLEKRTEDGNENCTWDIFLPSESMSVRSFGFVSSNYFVQNKTITPFTIFSAWSETERNHEFIYLMEIVPKLIKYYEDYFKIKLPTRSLHFFGISSIIPFITSKLGIVVLSEYDMIVKKNETSEVQKEKVAKTAAIHISEQWTEYFLRFNEHQDHWIKDSLEQYLQYSAVNSIEPSWKILDEFFTTVLQNEMDTEILNPTQKPLNVLWIPYLSRINAPHPLYPLNETAVFQNHFDHSKILYSLENEPGTDPIIYSELFVQRNINKGICLFRMLEHTLTESVFHNAVRKFLQYGKQTTVHARDLWNFMTDEASQSTGFQLVPSNLTIETIVNEWIFNNEYPVLKVVRNYNKGLVSFLQYLDSQHSFSHFAEAEKNNTAVTPGHFSSFRDRCQSDILCDSRPYQDSYNTMKKGFRHLPISYTTEKEKMFNSTSPKLWLKNTKQITIENPANLSNHTWFLVNLQQTGLYRVNYDDDNWKMLKNSLRKGDFPPTIRAQLLDDALFLGRRGYLNYEFALNLTKTLSEYGEREFIVWNTVLRHFSYIESILFSIDEKTLEKHRNLFYEYIKKLILPIYNTSINQQDKKKSNHSDLLLQALILNWACKTGIDECNTKMKMIFRQWKEQANLELHNPIDPNMRYTVLCSALRYGDASDFEFLYHRFLNTTSTDPNKPIYLRSLLCYSEISYTLRSILTETLLNKYSLTHLNDINDVWQALAENPVSSTLPLDYLLTYWKSILKKFTYFAPILKNIVEGATANVSKEDQLNAIYRLRKDTDEIPHLKDVFIDVIRHIKFRIYWKYQELHVFFAWLDSMNQNEINIT